MKQTLTEIIGKTVESVVVKTDRAHPRQGSMALYLGFSDATYIEIWTDTSGGIHPTGGVDAGGLEAMLSYGGAATVLVQKCWLERETGIVKNEYHSPND